MNLYRLTQTDNRGYDTYDSCVVVASTPETAAMILPDPGIKWETSRYHGWANTPGNVTVTYLGKADEPLKLNTCICASFNAG